MANDWVDLGDCGDCGEALRPAAGFCARCGRAAPPSRPASPRRIDLDSVRTAWSSRTPGSPHGPFLAPTPEDERLVAWCGAGDAAFLVTSAPAGGRIHHLSVRADGVQAAPTGVAFDLAALQAMEATRSGLFVLEGGKLWRLDRREDGWGHQDLTPPGARPVGMTADVDRVHVLAVRDDRLVLFSGRGQTSLSPSAGGPSGRVPPPGAWLTAASDGVRGVAWGSGLRIGIDHQAGRLSISEDARASDLPADFAARSRMAPFGGGRPGVGPGALVAVADVPSGWGVLDLVAQRFVEAPEALSTARSAVSISPRGVLVVGPAGPVLISVEPGSSTAAARPLRDWPGAESGTVALCGLDDEAVAIFTNAGAPSGAVTVRVGHENVLTVSGRADLGVDAMGRSSGVAAGSLPPLALDGGLLVALADARGLSIWRAPWAGG